MAVTEQGFEWVGVVNSTLKKFIREVEVDILRNRKLTALLKSKGRISMNWSGESMEWRIRYKRVNMQGYADMDTLQFQRNDRLKLANLDWRGYAITDAVSKKQRLMNKGTEGIVKVFDEAAKLLLEDITDEFSEEFYIDGTTAANAKRMHGIESFMGNSGANTDNLAYLPSQTFAGLSTIPGNYGGTWSGTWPTSGRGDASYDFWSPIIVKTGSSAWKTGATWAAASLEQLRYGIQKSRRAKSLKGVLDVVMLEEESYRGFLENLAQKERIQIERSKEQSPLIALGYNDAVNFDGVDVTYEYGIPSTVNGYGFNTDMMELRSLQDRLFVPSGPNWNEPDMTYRFAVDCFCNTCWSPRCFTKWLP